VANPLLPKSQQRADGVDCTSIAHVGTVDCKSSKCLIKKCKAGYRISSSGDTCVEKHMPRDTSPIANVDVNALINAVISALDSRPVSTSARATGSLVNVDANVLANVIASVLDHYRKLSGRDTGSLVNANINVLVNAVISILDKSLSARDDSPLINVDINVLVNALVSVLDNVV